MRAVGVGGGLVVVVMRIRVNAKRFENMHIEKKSHKKSQNHSHDRKITAKRIQDHQDKPPPPTQATNTSADIASAAIRSELIRTGRGIFR